jgi:hypothetical protein
MYKWAKFIVLLTLFLIVGCLKSNTDRKAGRLNKKIRGEDINKEYNSTITNYESDEIVLEKYLELRSRKSEPLISGTIEGYSYFNGNIYYKNDKGEIFKIVKKGDRLAIDHAFSVGPYDKIRNFGYNTALIAEESVYGKSTEYVSGNGFVYEINCPLSAEILNFKDETSDYFNKQAKFKLTTKDYIKNFDSMFKKICEPKYYYSFDEKCWKVDVALKVEYFLGSKSYSFKGQTLSSETSGCRGSMDSAGSSAFSSGSLDVKSILKMFKENHILAFNGKYKLLHNGKIINNYNGKDLSTAKDYYNYVGSSSSLYAIDSINIYSWALDNNLGFISLKKLPKAFSIQGETINWSSGIADGAPRLEAEIVETKLSPSRAVLLNIKVNNVGKGAVYQLIGIIDSENQDLNGYPIFFGKLAPGEIKSRKVKVPIGKFTETGSYLMNVNWVEIDGNVPPEITAKVDIKALPRPKLIGSLSIIDDNTRKSSGDGDGILQLGEAVDIKLSIQNVGGSDALDTKVNFGIKENENIKIFDPLEVNIGTLSKQEIGTVTLNMLVKRNFTGDSIPIEISISESNFNESYFLKEKINIGKRTDARQVGIPPHYVYSKAKNVLLYSGANLSSSLIGVIEKGDTAILVNAETDLFYKLADSDKIAWVKKADVKKNFNIEKDDVLDTNTLDESIKITHFPGPTISLIRPDKKNNDRIRTSNNSLMFEWIIESIDINESKINAFSIILGEKEIYNYTFENPIKSYRYSHEIPLSSGENNLRIFAKDIAGRISKKDYKVMKKKGGKGDYEKSIVINTSIPFALEEGNDLIINGKNAVITSVDPDSKQVHFLSDSDSIIKQGLNIIKQKVQSGLKLAKQGALKMRLWVNGNDYQDFKEPYKNSYALLITIDDYDRKEDKKKKYPPTGFKSLGPFVKNSKRLKNILKKRGFDNDRIIELYDSDATSENIEKELRTFWDGGSRADADMLFFYFGGHGTIINKKGALVTYDYDPKMPGLTSFLMKQLLVTHLDQIKARHVLVALDSCYSGTLLVPEISPNLLSNRDNEDLLALIKSDVSKRGRNILLAGSNAQKAIWQETGGIFTLSLIEALSGAGDRNNDGIIQFLELSQAVANLVVTKIKKLNINYEQIPTSSSLTHQYGPGKVVFWADTDE